MKISAYLKYFIFLISVPFFTVNAEKNKSSFDPKSIANLSFSDCEKLSSLLDEYSSNINTIQNDNKDKLDPLTAVQKQELAEAFSAILKLEAGQSLPLNLSGPSAYGTNTFSQRAGDLSLTLDPNNENKAKFCIVNNLKKILPESISLLPALVFAASRESSPRILRAKIVSVLRDLTTSELGDLNEFVLTNLIQKLNDGTSSLESELIIPPLAKLISLKFDYILTGLGSMSKQATLNIVHATLVANPDAKLVLKLLTNETKVFKNRNLRSELLNSLRLYPELLTEILNSLVSLVNASSGDELKGVLELLNSFGDKGLEYIKENNFSNTKEKVVETILNIISLTNISNLENVVELSSAIKISPDSMLCLIDSKSLLDLESDKGRYARELIIASVCPLSNKHVNFYLKELKEGSFLAKSVAVSALAESEASHDLVTKELLRVSKQISPKEYKQLCFLYIDRASRFKNTKQMTFAEKLISEEPSFPPYLSSSGQSSVISYFSNLGKQSLPIIKKLLNTQASSFNKISALKVVSSPECPFYKELLPYLVTSLSDRDLEIRRLAYLSLLRSKEALADLKQATNSNNDTTKFYSSRVILQNTNFNKVLDTIYLTQAVRSSLKLSCQERTSPISKIELLNTVILDTEVFRDFVHSQFGCLFENSQIRKRAIDNLLKLSPLPHDVIKILIESVLNKDTTVVKLQIQDYLRLGDVLFLSKVEKLQILSFINYVNKLAKSFDPVARLAYVDWLLKKSLDQNDIVYLRSDDLKDPIFELARTIFLSHKESEFANLKISKTDFVDNLISLIKDVEEQDLIILSSINKNFIPELLSRSSEIGTNKFYYLRMYACIATKGEECGISKEGIFDVFSEDSKLRIAEIHMINKLVEEDKNLISGLLYNSLKNRIIVSAYSGELFNKDILLENKYLISSMQLIKDSWPNQIEKNIFELSERIARF